LEFRTRVRAIHCILVSFITWGIFWSLWGEFRDHVQWRTVR